MLCVESVMQVNLVLVELKVMVSGYLCIANPWAFHKRQAHEVTPLQLPDKCWPGAELGLRALVHWVSIVDSDWWYHSSVS